MCVHRTNTQGSLTLRIASRLPSAITATLLLLSVTATLNAAPVSSPYVVDDDITEVMELTAGSGRLVNYTIRNTEIDEVEVADESVCQRIFRKTRTGFFELHGLSEGTTSIVIWTHDNNAVVKPIRFEVRVSYDYDQLAKSVNDVFDVPPTQGDVDIQLKLLPTGDKVVVSGRVKYQRQADVVMSLLRSAKIDEKRLVSRLTIGVPELQELADFVNNAINRGHSTTQGAIMLERSPVTGKVLVTGEVCSCDTLSRVRQLIESNALPAATVIYDVKVTCAPAICVPACCRTRRR